MSGGTNTQTQTLPNWLQPYLTNELAGAANLTPGLSQGSPAASSLVAPFNSTQQSGVNQMVNTANTSNPSASAAAANEFETSGALLNPNANPYLQNTFNLASQSVQNNLDSQFAGSGSNVENSIPVQADQMNDLATQLYGGEYNQGLTAMTQASALAPSIQQGTYIPGQQLLNAGNVEQQQGQQVINAPYNALSWYSGLLGLNGSSLGGSSQTNNGSAALQDTGAGLAGLGSLAEILGMFAVA